MRRISDEYYTLFRRALEEPEGVLIQTAAKKESVNMRSYLYHFRSQLRESQPNFLKGEYEQLVFTIEPKGLRIHKKGAPGEDVIRKSLKT